MPSLALQALTSRHTNPAPLLPCPPSLPCSPPPLLPTSRRPFPLPPTLTPHQVAVTCVRYGDLEVMSGDNPT